MNMARHNIYIIQSDSDWFIIDISILCKGDHVIKHYRHCRALAGLNNYAKTLW